MENKRKPTKIEVALLFAGFLVLTMLAAYDLYANHHVSDVLVGIIAAYALTAAGYGVDVARWMRR